MREKTTFEHLLEDAFDRYAVAGAPLDADPHTLAVEAVSGGGRRRGLALRIPAAPRGLLLAASVGLLLLTLLAAALMAGALPVKPRAPLGGGGRILVTYPTGPSHLLTIDGDRAVAREVRVRGCPRTVGNADATATMQRFVGIRYEGFDGGVSEPISTKYAGGERWSADNRVLALVDWTHGTVTFVTIPGNDVEHPAQLTVAVDVRDLPVTTDGYPMFEGNFSPDGRSFLLVTYPDTGGGTPRNRLSVLDVGTGASRALTDVPAITPTPVDPIVGVAWAPGNSAIAFASTVDGMSQVGWVSTESGQLTWLGHPQGVPDAADLVVQAWSPDASRIAVWADGSLWFVDADGGTWQRTPLAGPNSPTTFAMTPDGRKAGVVNGSVLTVLDVPTGTMEVRRLGGSTVAWSPDRSALSVLEPSAGAGPTEVLVYDPWTASEPVRLFTVPEESSFPVGGTGGPCLQWLSEVSP